MTGGNRVAPPQAGPAAGERPTLKTISRITGLAVATVSRALNDAPDIGEDTKRRVREVAAEIGYRPNRAGVRLRTGRTHVISLVMATNHDMMNHTARLITSTVAALRGTPYHMIVTPYFPGEDPMAPIRYIVETGSADGVIFNQTQPRDARVEYLMQQGFPFATHGRSDWRDRHAYFDFDNGAYGRLAVEMLADRGRRDILLVAPPMDQNYAIDMDTAARAAAKARGVRLRRMEGCTSDSNAAEIEAAMAGVMAGPEPPDAVICASTSAAMAVTAAAEAAGRVIGGDFDVFGKEAIPFLRQFRPGILAVHEDVAAAGDFLARAVTDRIANPDGPPMQRLEVARFRDN